MAVAGRIELRSWLSGNALAAAQATAKVSTPRAEHLVETPPVRA